MISIDVLATERIEVYEVNAWTTKMHVSDDSHFSFVIYLGNYLSCYLSVSVYQIMISILAIDKTFLLFPT